MSLIVGPFCQFFDEDGLPLAFAEVYFTDTQTTNPIAVYQTNELDTIAGNEHPFPVVCDVKGRMPAVYFKQDDLIRMRVIPAGGNLDFPEIDIDPVTEVFTVGAANLQDGAIEEKLGYTPLSTGSLPGEDPQIITENIRMNFVPTDLNEDDIGYRGTPRFIVNVNTDLLLRHSGGFIIKDGTDAITITLQPESTINFPIGHWVDIFNANTADITLARGSGVELIEAEDNTFANANKTLNPGNKVRLYKIDTDRFMIA